MTLLEILMVAVIVGLAASGLGFSLGAISRTNLKAGADRIGSAVRYAYNRAVTHGTTVRIRFNIPGNTFSIEEGHAGVTLARAKEKQAKQDKFSTKEQKLAAAVDPWAAAKMRISQPLKPSFGASPFSALEAEDGKVLKRFKDVKLPHTVQIVKLLVPHEPEPLSEGEGALHFFPGGRTEHAVIQLGDGRQGVYSVEIQALTGHVSVHAGAYEPHELLEEADEGKGSETRNSEVDAP